MKTSRRSLILQSLAGFFGFSSLAKEAGSADPSSTFKVQNPDPNAKRWMNGRTTYRENSQPIRTEARYDERGRLVLQKDYFASATP